MTLPVAPTRAPHRWSVRGAWASQGMRQGIGLSVFGQIAMLVGLIWPSTGGEGSLGSWLGFALSIGLCATWLALTIAVAVRGAGRWTVALISGSGAAIATLVAGGGAALIRGVDPTFVVMALVIAPAALSGLTIRVPLGGDKIKLYPATAARVEITRDHDGVFAIRHPWGHVLACGADAVRLLQGLAGPLADHGLLWGGDSAADTQSLDATALAGRLDGLLSTRTTLPRPVHHLPMEVWESLLGLEAEHVPVVAEQLAVAATRPPGAAVGPAADDAPAVDRA